MTCLKHRVGLSSASAPRRDHGLQVCRANKAANQRLFERYDRNRRARGGQLLDEVQPVSVWTPGAGLLGLLPPLEQQPPGTLSEQLAAPLVDKHQLNRLLELYRSMPEPLKPRQRRQLAPEALADAVRPEGLAAALEKLGRRKVAVVVEPPEALRARRGAAATPLPPLPPPASTAAAVQLHVFWDVESLGVGEADPRAAVQQLRNALSAYGSVAGVYAYGVRKAFNWVPEAFMRRYAPSQQRGDGGGGGSGGGRSGSSGMDGSPDSQQQEQASPSPRTQSGGLIQGQRQQGGGMVLVCPMCGTRVTAYKSLQVHMKRIHDAKAPPLDDMLPDAPGAGSGSPTAMRNSPARTLGKVAGYYSASGQLFLPQPGHQISLKYVLLREGVEVRLVQNYKEDVGVAVRGGVAALLAQLRLRRPAEVGAAAVVVVVASERPEAWDVLRAVAREGHGALALRGRADDDAEAAGEGQVVLGWRELLAGAYRVPPADAGAVSAARTAGAGSGAPVGVAPTGQP